ncbi:metallophosphoesterase [bacterium]|nr:metallophosphoesterase [bacterium]
MRKLLVLMLIGVSIGLTQEDDFSFVILGDRTGDHQEGVYGAVVEKSLAEGADFYITVGDQIEGYANFFHDINEQWEEYFGIVEHIPVELYLVPGNHDIWDDAFEGLWREWTGREPNYSFDYEGVHFLILDNGRWDFTADLPEETFAWVVDDLSYKEDARLTLVFFHKPLIYYTLTENEGDRLHKILLEHGVDGVFMGHLHTYGYTDYDGIPYTIIGSSGGHISAEDFFQYAVVNVERDSYTVEIVPLESE